MLVHNTCRHNGKSGDRESEVNINVILSSHHASILIIISKIDDFHIHHSFYKYKKYLDTHFHVD